MARIRPTQPLRSHFIYGEGPTEGAFLRWLKLTFHPRGAGFQVQVKWDDGGAPVNILNRAIAVSSLAAFDSMTILMDTDRPWDAEDVIRRAATAKIRLLPSEPCLEGLLLSILGRSVPADSRECKRLIHAEIPERQMLFPAAFGRLLASDTVLARAPEIPTLQALLDLLREGVCTGRA